MKKLIAILAVLGTFAFAPAAFAQNRHHDGGVNVRVSPYGGGSISIGGNGGRVTIGDHRFDNRGYDNRGYDRGRRDWDDRRDYRGYDRRDYRGDDRGYRDYDRGYGRFRGPSIIIGVPGFYYGPSYQRPYTYFDRFGREIYVDRYGRASYTGYTRGRDYDYDDCDCN